MSDTNTSTCLDLPLIIRADSKAVLEEMQRRGIWASIEPGVRMGSVAVLLDETPNGMDAFFWIGAQKKGGFFQWTLVGGHPGMAACNAMVNRIHELMPRGKVAAIYGKDGSPWQS